VPVSGPAPPPAGRRWARIDQARGGLAGDLALYLLSAGYAALTAVTATLPPHAAWGGVARWGYAAAAALAGTQLLLARRVPRLTGTGARAALTAASWLATCAVPLVLQAVQRAAGHPGRAQEEVVVVEDAGYRLLHTGTPYLTRTAIAALPGDERLLGYLPYQPGMALFGLPRAVFGVVWWTDARVWFALATAGCLLAALRLLRPGRAAAGAVPAGSRLVRAAQAAAVVPLCTLALAVGGDDLPVLGLCLLALAAAAAGRYGLAGVAAGLAGALKLFAWPVLLALLALALARHAGRRYAPAALGLPALAVLPALLVDPGAAAENLLRFPLGQGLVRSPAASPLPGHLIAATGAGGRAVALGLLLAAGAALAWWLVRRTPQTAAAAAGIAAVGMLAVTLLLPATRFGYLLYPVAYALWVPVLSPDAIRLPAGSAAPTMDQAVSPTPGARER